MIGFIDDHRKAHGVEPICKVLPIAPSTHRAEATRRRDPAKQPARTGRDAALMNEIERVFEENSRITGVRKVWRQMSARAMTWRGAPSCDCCAAWACRAVGRLRANILLPTLVRIHFCSPDAWSQAASGRDRRTRNAACQKGETSS
jgi:hypothetical protein